MNLNDFFGIRNRWVLPGIAASLVLLVVIVISVAASNENDSDYEIPAGPAATSKRTYTEGERRYVAELDTAGLMDPNYTVAETIEMGHNICAQLDQRSYDSAKDLADYLYEEQVLEEMEYYNKVSWETIYQVVTIAHFTLCP